MGKIFYIADLHFGHANIIKLSNRPFDSVDEMDEALINNWNKVVSDNDRVYIVGDFSFSRDVDKYISRLTGEKFLIKGNHDKDIIKKLQHRQKFVDIKDIYRVYDGDNKIVLCHYPLVEWDGFFRGVKHFYGHIHNNTENATYQIMKSIPNAYNVGADILDYTPREYDEVVWYNQKFDDKH